MTAASPVPNEKLSVKSNGEVNSRASQRILRFLVSPCPILLVWVPYALCGGGFLLSVILFSPGVVTHDVFMLYGQSLTGVYTDWHPPVFAATWKLLREFQNCITGSEGTGREFFWFIQILLIWGGVFLLLNRQFWKNSKNVPVWMVLILCSLLLPILVDVTFRSQTLHKESLLLGCYLTGVGCLLAMPSKIFSRCAVGLFVLLLLFYGTSLRHNLIFALLPLLFWLVWHFLPTQFRKIVCIIPCGLILWGLFLTGNNYVNYHVLNAYRLYSMHECFYSDIFILNHYAPYNYKNPPNSFGNKFEDVTQNLFAERYDKYHVFQNRAFARINDATSHKNIFNKEFVHVSPDDDIQEFFAIQNTAQIPRIWGNIRPLQNVGVNTIKTQYPQDYATLRSAWIERIQQDIFVYFYRKTMIWLHFMNRNFRDGSSALISAPFGGLLPFAIVTLISLQTFSARRLEAKVLPQIMLAWSALFTALPLIIFLPDDTIRYLYWFFAASFIAIVHFCANSPLFHEIIQTIHRYLEKKAELSPPQN